MRRILRGLRQISIYVSYGDQEPRRCDTLRESQHSKVKYGRQRKGVVTDSSVLNRAAEGVAGCVGSRVGRLHSAALDYGLATILFYSYWVGCVKGLAWKGS